MKRLWAWWVARGARDESALVLALVRVLCCAAIVLDLLGVVRLGLQDMLWRTYDQGGLSTIQSPWGPLEGWDPAAAQLTLWVTVVALILGGLGVLTRPALLVGIVGYAWLGHLYPPGDRAIDRLLRTALLLCLVGGSHHRLSLMGLRRDRIAAWPADLARLTVVLVYLTAGPFKIFSSEGWFLYRPPTPLFRILTNPMAGRLDAVTWAGTQPLMHGLGAATVVFECLAFLVFTRLGPYWALGGVALHLGIATTMNLGMFSWGMLALYPLFFSRWIEGWEARRSGRS